MSLSPGTRLDGYELIQILGSGGMGEVWLARDVGLGRKVALKLLPLDFQQRPTPRSALRAGGARGNRRYSSGPVR